jgi:hypothetical protein
MPVHFNLIEMPECPQAPRCSSLNFLKSLSKFKPLVHFFLKDIFGSFFLPLVKSVVCRVHGLWLSVSLPIFLSPGHSPRLKLY